MQNEHSNSPMPSVTSDLSKMADKVGASTDPKEFDKAFTAVASQEEKGFLAVRRSRPTLGLIFTYVN